jgi:hypothetical protein
MKDIPMANDIAERWISDMEGGTETQLAEEITNQNCFHYNLMNLQMPILQVEILIVTKIKDMEGN